MAQKKPVNNKYVVGRSLQNGTYHPKNSPRPKPSQPPEAEIPETEPSPRRYWKRILVAIFVIILIPTLVIGIWDVRNLSSASKKMFSNGNLLEALTPTTLHGTDHGRVNMLIVGYSKDDPGHSGASLTDSIMVLSMDTQDHTGYMLSIPRDMYVSIPDYHRAKINEAYPYGETVDFQETGYPRGGMGLLEKTVEETFNIPIDYYALINYAAVKETTDALGGITVTISSSDPRGIYDPNFKPEEGGPLKLSNGQHTIDGQTALRLTRARGSTSGSYGLALSDFDRTKNQQQVLLAMKNELGPSVILDPRKNEAVLNAIASNVETDLKINEVIPFYRLFNGIPNEQLRSVSLRDINGKNLLTSYATPSGQSALIPAAGVGDYSDIRETINKLNQ